MIPEGFFIRFLGQLRDAHTVLIRRDMLRFDVHRDFTKIHIRTDPGRRRDPRALQHIPDQHACEVVCAAAIGLQIPCRIDKHFIHGIREDILRRDILQIDTVDPGTHFHIFRHLRRRDNKVHRQRRVRLQFLIEITLPGKCFCRRSPLPFVIDLFDLLQHLEEPRAARDTVALQRRRYRQADGLLRPRRVSHHEVSGQRIEPSRDALHAGIERLQIDRDIRSLHADTILPDQTYFLYYSTVSEYLFVFYIIFFGMFPRLTRFRVRGDCTA